ncbi:MAG: linear amide C-N hydrolase [Limosilactobacillus mucosae]|nr:linear amide C-N hydrolase [Limosilactobacillus mucosae]MCI6052223.1 linear amide C-N hydrolase [Limosilactobacillus mucosae]MDY5413345.1 linear amide C-N hydrolase [Limosilactobacillus mucosae]
MCTAISFTTRQRHRFVGRTMDFPTRSTPWQLGYLPIDYQWQSLPECDSFANDYAILGGMRKINHHYLIGDGLNSAGLWAAELYFPGPQVYYDHPQSHHLNLSPQDLIGWLLGTHASVAEIAAELDSVALNGVIWHDHDIVHPFHWLLSDATGTYLIEPTQLDLKIQPIQLGVLTNSPRYAKQRQKLTSYLGIDPKASDAEVMMAIRSSKAPLPSQRTPTSRFINAAVSLWQSSPFDDSDQEAFRLSSKILKQVEMNQLPGHDVYTHYREIVDAHAQTSYFYDLTTRQKLVHRLPDLMARFDQPSLFKS